MAKSKKLILDNQLLENEFFEDVHLIGIVCPEAPHYLAWQIGDSSPYPFIRQMESDIFVDDIFYPVYFFLDQKQMLEHYLIANRTSTHFMLPELKNIDFIWMSKGVQFPDIEKQGILSLLRHLPTVTAFFELPNHQIKQRQHLII